MAPPDRPRRRVDTNGTGASRRPKAKPRPASARTARPPVAEAPRSWGNVARRGAKRLGDADPLLRHNDPVEHPRGRPAPFEAERWERVDEVRSEAGRAAARGRSPSPGVARREPIKGESKRRAPRPAGPGSAGERAERELANALGPARGVRAARQLREAARAFERERFVEARSVLRPLAELAPSSPSVRELLGLTYYRLGRWKLAVRELEAFASLTSSTEQHPILADSYRALGRWARVEELWEELRAASPGADLVAEGRIVLAGSMADRGDVAGAIAVLEKAKTRPQRPKAHHLRMAYALADLRERAGDVAGARQLFGWVAHQDPQFADAAERAHTLA